MKMPRPKNILNPTTLYCLILLLGSFQSTHANTHKPINDTTASKTNISKSLIDLPAYRQAELIASGQLRSEDLVNTYLQRIQAMDKQGPRVQAVISINPDALNIAKQKDKEAANARKNKQPLGKLHGIPVLVKDNIETSNMPTTAGSMALMHNMTLRDAPIIAKLKAQGAIILGKTNLSEWANFRDNDSISGWSAMGGQTRNPHSLDRTPCGSSAGSGAGMAAQFASLTIGTETNGSIICPATMNGIVGHKPTVGLMSRRHIVPISVTQDTAGPMTRNVHDAALMLSIMAGTDSLDATTKNADVQKVDYTRQLNASIAGKRIGVMRFAQSNHPDIIEQFNHALTVLESHGAVLIDIEEYKIPDEFWDKSLQVLLIEFKQQLNEYLYSTPDTVNVRNLAELITFNQNTPRELRLFKQSLLHDSQATQGYNDEYHALIKFLRSATRTNGIDKLLQQNELDLLVSPTQTPAFLIDPVYGDSFPGGFAGAGWMAAIAGYPHITVPMGNMKGLPIGISFIGRAFDDELLFNIAYKYEQSTQALITPSFAEGAINHPSLQEAMSPLKLK